MDGPVVECGGRLPGGSVGRAGFARCEPLVGTAVGEVIIAQIGEGVVDRRGVVAVAQRECTRPFSVEK